MVQPIDYSGGFAPRRPPQLFQDVMQVRALQDQKAKQAQAMQQSQLFQRDYAEAAQGGFTPQKLIDLDSRHPGMLKNFKTIFDQVADEEKAGYVRNIVPIHKALQSGDNKVALELAERTQEAYRNAGDEGKAQQYGLLIEKIQQGQGGLITSGMLAVGDPERVETYEKVEMLPGAVEAQDVGIEATRAQIGSMADKRKMDEAKLFELSEKEREKVNALSTDAFDAETRANDAILLADQIDKEVKDAGILAKGTAAWKEFWGTGGRHEELRQRYSAQKAQGIVSSLPPGVASDTDIKLISGGFPDKTANPALISKFLRTYAKLQRKASLRDDVQSRWIENNRILGKAKNDFEILGIKANKGETWADFMKKNKAKLYSDENIIKNASEGDQSTLSKIMGAVLKPLAKDEEPQVYKFQNIVFPSKEKYEAFMKEKEARGL